ncbi:MAG: hypothetical protein Q9163_001455 [Psora crenata]
MSCHQTLIRLGDLSRWRETQLVTKERNWGPAIGYYELAGTIYAASGASHHQLAVIAQVNEDSFRTIYHLYRALAVAEPHPGARGNLDLQLQKIAEHSAQGALVANASYKDGPNSKATFTDLVLRIHAAFHRIPDLSKHEETESEVMKQLIKAPQAVWKQGTVKDVVLINLAAEYYAGMRLRGETVPPGANGNRFGSPTVTAKMRRVIPSLRQYSSWLVSQAAILAGQTADASLNALAGDLGKLYIHVLNLLLGAFSVSDLPCIEYMLEEDEETIGFAPLDGPEYERMKRRYYQNDTVSRKPKWHGKGIKRLHPTKEMLGRVGDLLADGLYLHTQDNVPIRVYQGRFTNGKDRLSTEGSQNSQFPNSITHISETKLFSPDPSASKGASRTPSTDEPANKEQDEELFVNATHGISSSLEHAPDEQGPLKDILDETSYSLIDSLAAREHFGDLGQPRGPARPGEGGFQWTHPPPSQNALTNGLRPQEQQQQQQSGLSVEDTLSSMPDPTNPASVQSAYCRSEQVPFNRQPRISSSQVGRDDTTFLSAAVFTGSNQTLPMDSQAPVPGQAD